MLLPVSAYLATVNSFTVLAQSAAVVLVLLFNAAFQVFGNFWGDFHLARENQVPEFAVNFNIGVLERITAKVNLN
jgi:hypothetical protein